MTHMEESFKARFAAFWQQISVRLTFKEKLSFTKYLSVLLSSGMPIDTAISVLHKQSSGSLKQILDSLKKGLLRGDTLTSALTEYDYIFGPVYINLISAGESSGTLQENLNHLVVQMEKDYDVRRKVTGAMVYPAIVVASGIIICIGIVVFVLPNVLQIFTSLDVVLPLPTRILLWIAAFVGDHGFLTVFLTVGVVVLMAILWSIPLLKPFFHRVVIGIPIIGSIVKKTNLARITRLISIMLKSGLAIDTAIPLTRRVVKNAQYQRLLDQLEADVEKGLSMTSVLKEYPALVPPMVMQVVSAGEEAGTLDDMLSYMATFYEKELDDTMQNLSSTLEPILLIFVGLLVGGLALAVLTPIYQVVGSF